MFQGFQPITWQTTMPDNSIVQRPMANFSATPASLAPAPQQPASLSAGVPSATPQPTTPQFPSFQNPAMGQMGNPSSMFQPNWDMLARLFGGGMGLGSNGSNSNSFNSAILNMLMANSPFSGVAQPTPSTTSGGQTGQMLGGNLSHPANIADMLQLLNPQSAVQNMGGVQSARFTGIGQMANLLSGGGG